MEVRRVPLGDVVLNGITAERADRKRPQTPALWIEQRHREAADGQSGQQAHVSPGTFPPRLSRVEIEGFPNRIGAQEGYSQQVPAMQVDPCNRQGQDEKQRRARKARAPETFND